MKLTPPIAGLLQSVALTSYVALVVTFMRVLDTRTPPSSETLQGMTVLLLFVLSAMICTTIMFVYPVLLVRDKKIKQALTVIGWSIGWLAILFFVTLTIAFTR